MKVKYEIQDKNYYCKYFSKYEEVYVTGRVTSRSRFVPKYGDIDLGEFSLMAELRKKRDILIKVILKMVPKIKQIFVRFFVPSLIYEGVNVSLKFSFGHLSLRNASFYSKFVFTVN